eukprot:m.230153 g.230153  ORF g.230153 m.230153 type:complete len:1340 (-) comp33572_c0_seq14:24-4043(-)
MSRMIPSSPLLLLFFAISGELACVIADSTDWGIISTKLTTRWSASLPPAPEHIAPMDLSQWAGPVTQDAQFAFAIAVPGATSMCTNISDTATWPDDAVVAGPLTDCGDTPSSWPCNNQPPVCKATDVHNNANELVVLRQLPASHWLPQQAQPSWAMMRFPKIAAKAEVVFRFTIDARYRPHVSGGNPCDVGNHTAHNCSLCVGDDWDHSVAAGLRLLWSYPGASKHVISEPIALFTEPWNDSPKTMLIDSPVGLNLTGQAEVIVTVLHFNQYMAYTGELSVDKQAALPRCTVQDTKAVGDITQHRDIGLGIMSAEVFTRAVYTLNALPDTDRPRLFGNNDVWYSSAVAPFYTGNCSTNVGEPGWGSGSGFPDFKGYFETRTLGYSACRGTANSGTTIWDHSSVKPSYANAAFESFKGNNEQTYALQVFHLIRRMRHCHAGASQPDVDCQYNVSETAALALNVVTQEFVSFDSGATQRNDASWGWEQTTDGCCGFDLFTTNALRHYAVFVDVLASDAQAADMGTYNAILNKMKFYLEDFVLKYDAKHWSLFNGNNWTPVLSEGAMYASVALWHDFPSLAEKVIHMVTDIMFLHIPMTTEKGAYSEGVCQYSYMSIRSTMAVAVLYERAFNTTFVAIDVTRLEKMAQWHIDSTDSAGYTIDFGDSHACRGTSPATLMAAAAKAIVGPPLSTDSFDSPDVIANIDACMLRTWAAMAYFLQFKDPWQIWPIFAAPWASRAKMCGASSSSSAAAASSATEPLGAARVAVYEDVGYTMFRTPLLSNCSAAAEAVWGCSNDGDRSSVLPQLSDGHVYSQLSVQSRPNSFPHSEVDFGTFKWCAYGASLLTENGYGTISQSIAHYDYRRFLQLDNNPAGHNTVIINEAFQDEDEQVNWSQENFVRGTTELVQGTNLDCSHLDGSKVYGSERRDGWLDSMHRWTCSFGLGHFIVIDSFAVKHNRDVMVRNSGEYGGVPMFNESTRHTRLTIDEYFHAPHWLNGQSELDGVDVVDLNDTMLEFTQSTARWCHHTDITVVDNHTVLLKSRCGFDNDENKEAAGLIKAWSSRGGHFVHDGLKSVGDRWGVPKLHQQRFRFRGDTTVGSEGDVRAFVLASMAPDTPAPNVVFVPCIAGDAIASNGTCISFCVENDRYSFTVNDINAVATLTNATAGGSCECAVGGKTCATDETCVDLQDSSDCAPLPTPTPTIVTIATTSTHTEPVTVNTTDTNSTPPTATPTTSPTLKTISPTTAPTNSSSPTNTPTISPTIVQSVDATSNGRSTVIIASSVVVCAVVVVAIIIVVVLCSRRKANQPRTSLLKVEQQQHQSFFEVSNSEFNPPTSGTPASI